MNKLFNLNNLVYVEAINGESGVLGYEVKAQNFETNIEDSCRIFTKLSSAKKFAKLVYPYYQKRMLAAGIISLD